MAPRRTIERARQLRRELTLPEVKLWLLLGQRPGGMRCRRQHPVGPYVLDFYCATARLAIEVDGQAHDRAGRPERDARRDAWLEQQGIATMRILASEVLADPNQVVEGILARCALPLHRPADGPSPHAGHGEDVGG